MALAPDLEELRRLVTQGDGAWHLDLPSGSMSADETSWRALGYDDPATRPAWSALLHPEDEPLAWAAVSDGVAQGTMPPYTLRLRQRDGAYRRVLGRGLVVARADDGAPLALAGFHTFLAPLGDVQPRDQRHEALLAALPDVLAVLFRDGTLSAVQAGGDPDLRAALQGQVGSHLGGVWTPEAGRALADELARTLAGEASRALEIDWAYDGRPHRYELRLSRLTPVTALLLVRDVTFSASTAALLERISAAVPGLVYLYRRWPGGREAFLYVNAQAERILGVPAEAIRRDARAAWSAVLPEDLPLLREEVERSARDGSPFAPTFRVRVGGEVRWLRARATPTPEPDGAITWAGVLIDVTAEILAAEERRRSADAAARGERLEQLGLMAGGIAHDFNNLLVGVFGAAAQLGEELGPAHPAAAVAREIEHAARQMADITRQMLNFSGRNPAPARRVDLSRAVRDSLALVQASAGGGARLEPRLAREGPAVAIDPGQVTQLLANLVINAADAIGPRPGTIWVETGTAEVGAEELERSLWRDHLPPGACAYLEIRDDGPGIAPEVRERLFEPYVTTKDAGRGLGLAVVGGIVRGCGGAVLVDSAPGQGTRIRLLFPLAPAEEPPAERAHTPAPARAAAGVTVLVVDDEPFVRSVARRILERAGHTVIVANDGQMALELARSTRLDLALVDATMPGMSGGDVLRALAALAPDLPLVLMSGYAREEVRDAAVSAAAGFLPKPFSPEDLREAVRRALAARATG